jgi:hypothetical protein
MRPNLKELSSTLNAHKAKYLIVGGYAVGFHAQPRATKDLDIFIRPDAQNAKAVYDALATFGAPLQGITPNDLLGRDGFFRMGHAPVMIEILPSIEGVEFDDAWQGRVEIVIDAETGLTAFMLSREDLITAKLAAGRPQDLADVDALRKAEEVQSPPLKKTRSRSRKASQAPGFPGRASWEGPASTPQEFLPGRIWGPSVIMVFQVGSERW